MPDNPNDQNVDLTGAVPQDTTSLVDSWRGWLAKPENRAGLVQFGLQMMQPIGAGQTPIGHAAEAAGAGFEAHDVNLVERAKAASEQQQQSLEERKVAAQETAAKSKGGVPLSTLFTQRATAARGKSAAWAKYVEDNAKSIATQANDPLQVEGNPYVEFKGKTEADIRDFILNDPTWQKRLKSSFELLHGGPGAIPEGGQTPPTTPTPEATPEGTGGATVSAFLAARKSDWDAAVADLKSGDPQRSTRAKGWFDRLKGVVSDPQTVDQMLGGQ